MSPSPPADEHDSSTLYSVCLTGLLRNSHQSEVFNSAFSTKDAVKNSTRTPVDNSDALRRHMRRIALYCLYVVPVEES